MQIKKIHHKDLLQFIVSEEYKTSKYLPISEQRAISHFHHPRAQPDDLVLVLIYEQGEMVAYLGVFPEELHFNNGQTTQKEHAGFLSCMWVNPNQRGKGLAKKLINTVFEAWDYRILVTEFTPAAKGLYDRTGQFLDLVKPGGLRCYLRLNLAYLLPGKNPGKWQRWRWALRWVDGAFNFFNGLRLRLASRKAPTYRYIGAIDEEAWQFIQQHRSPHEFMQRGKEELQWMVRYPWLISGGVEDDAAKRYHFSSVAKHFSFLNIKIYKKQELIGFLILSVRDKNMKVPYAYFDKKNVTEVAQVIQKHLLELKLDMLTVFHPALVAHFNKNKGPFFMRRPMQRHYIISKVFEEQLAAQEKVDVQDGDADAAFT